MAGAKPSFTKTHLVQALLELHKGRCSRKTLVEKLGLGEGSVRTILKQLARDELVSSNKGGHSLTPKGVESAEGYLSLFSKPRELKSKDMLAEGTSVFTVIYDSKDKLTPSATAESVIALKAGAKTSVILEYTEGKIRFPSEGVEISEYPKTLSELTGLELNPKDVIIIASADTPAKAKTAVLAVALNLI
jgi:hypothetical protein